MQSDLTDITRANLRIDTLSLQLRQAESKLEERDREVEALREVPDYARSPEMLLQWRRIQPGDECPKCGGAGTLLYGSTATWRGGIGGAAMTVDVCHVCWGSGSRKPWPSHDTLTPEEKPHG